MVHGWPLTTDQNCVFIYSSCALITDITNTVIHIKLSHTTHIQFKSSHTIQKFKSSRTQFTSIHPIHIQFKIITHNSHTIQIIILNSHNSNHCTLIHIQFKSSYTIHTIQIITHKFKSSYSIHTIQIIILNSHMIQIITHTIHTQFKCSHTIHLQFKSSVHHCCVSLVLLHITDCFYR